MCFTDVSSSKMKQIYIHSMDWGLVGGLVSLFVLTVIQAHFIPLLLSSFADFYVLLKKKSSKWSFFSLLLGEGRRRGGGKKPKKLSRKSSREQKSHCR